MVALLLLSFLAGAVTTARAEGPARRLVSLSPSVSAVLVDLGAVHALVGVDPVSADLPALRGVRALPDRDPDSVLALRPDLVLGRKDAGLAPVYDTLRERGVPVHIMASQTLAQVFAAYRDTATRLGHPERGDPLVFKLSRALAGVSASLQGLPRHKAVLVLGHDPLQVAGGTSLYTNLMEVAGAENALERFMVPVATVSLAQLRDSGAGVLVDGASTPWSRQVPMEGDTRPGWRTHSIALGKHPPLAMAELLGIARGLRRIFYPHEARFAIPSTNPPPE